MDMHSKDNSRLIQNKKNQRARAYISARQQHPAWLLLASTTGPAVLSCLQALFSENRDGIEFESALLELTDVLREQHETGDLELKSDDHTLEAKKELRSWIKKKLIIERDGKILATDALESALRFVESLENRIMTSTASRLSVVQREIESLETNLNPDPKIRAAHLKQKIKSLERELASAKAGKAPVLNRNEAIEAIREIYNLAISLRTDFRRVEDSFRQADQRLRQSIISEQNHRGKIVDKLLDSHDSLLETDEGKVFHSFQQQLSRTVELDNMKNQLRNIVSHLCAKEALKPDQLSELRWLAMRLVEESESVIRARARSERDVKSFLKSGLAAEHHRVGELLNDIFQQALDIDWASQTIRRSDSSLPPVAIANSGLPLVERLRFKSLDEDEAHQLDFAQQVADLGDMDDEFWAAFDELDRIRLINETKALLQAQQRVMGIADIAKQIPPIHDLESIVLWLDMALQADVPIHSETEFVDVLNAENGGMDTVGAMDSTRSTIKNSTIKNNAMRFKVPVVELTSEAVKDIEVEG